MNKAELVAKHWFLRRPGDAAEGSFYLPGTNPYQQRGIECDDGWLPLLDELFSKIAVVVKRDKLTTFEVSQVKEKFGGLRVYIGGGNDEIYALIREAEKLASVTCEQCGKPGKLVRGGWMVTRCDRCEARWKRQQRKDDKDENE